MKLNPYKYYADTTTAHLQVVFLTRVLHFTYEVVSEITRYAISTIRTFYYRFKDCVEKAKQIFQYNDCIIWDAAPTDKACGYVLEFWDGNKLLFLKIGMTTNIQRRVKEHLRNYNKNKRYEKLICKVKMVYETSSEENAIIIEAALREFYKEKYKNAYIRQDRFLGVSYQQEEKDNRRFCDLLQIAKHSV